MGHRRTAALIVACLPAVVAAGCAAPFRKPSRPVDPPPNVETVDAKVHPAIADFGAIEVAVLRPSGSGVSATVLDAFRQGLYDGLLERGYSPLALSFVDEAGRAAAEPGRTFPLRARITDVVTARDGGHLASGWAGLLSVRADGGEDTLYVSEITRLAIPPQKGTAVRDGGAETGRRLATALLRHLPAR